MTHASTCLTEPLIGRCIGDHDRYQLKAHIGKGGMGDVYQAIDTRLGKTVAVKLLRTSITEHATTAQLDFKRRFERECAIGAALTSENIVQVSDYGITAEGHPFYVMEYLEGQTLAQLLAQEKQLSWTRTQTIFKQICAGLLAAHDGVIFQTGDHNHQKRMKIIHRDLKPANIFLVPTPLGERVKIIDFGVAKIQSLQSESMTQAFLGTHHYAAPEQFDPDAEIDERADIYCCGLILYEMLTGVDPFGLGASSPTITGESWINAHLVKPVRPLRQQPGCESLPASIERAITQCLAKYPEERFSSVLELADVLDTAGTGLSASEALNLNHRIHQPNAFRVHEPSIGDALKHWVTQCSPLPLITRLFQGLNTDNLRTVNEASQHLTRDSVFLVPPTLNPEFLDRCQIELAEYIGPIAKLIIEDTRKDKDCQNSRSFIKALAKHIPDPQNSYAFQSKFMISESLPAE